MKKLLVFGVLIAVFLGCETPTDDSGSSSSKKKSTPVPVPDPVVIADSYAYTEAAPYYKINFNGADIVNLTVAGAAGKTAYLVKTNMSHNSAVAAANSGYAQSVNDAAMESMSNAKSVSAQDDTVSMVWENGVVRKEHRQAALFNSNPPVIDSKSQKSMSIMEKTAAVNYGDAGTYTAGTTTKNFWVENASGTWVSVTATLRSIGQYSYIWVPDTYYSNSSVSQTDHKLTQAQIDAFSLKFNGTAGNSYNDGIFKWVTNVYGYEYGGGSGNGGRDGDQHISILLYDIGYDYVSTQTGGVLGYFWGKDYYTTAELQNYGYTHKSNYSEIFYIDVHFTDKYTQMIYSTLAHEYQHMINFNRKSLEKDLDTSTWYNEMLSMLCEDLLVDKLITPSTSSPVNRLRCFNYGYDWSGVTDWLREDGVYYSYASAYAFGAYISRNFGGPAFIKAMIDSNSVDFQSVTDALVACGKTGYTFDTILEKYGQALVYESTPAGSDVVHFNKSTSSTIGGVDYNLNAIKLWDIEQIKKNSSGVYGKGPWIYDITALKMLRPCGMTMHSSSAWENISGDISIKFYKPSGNVNYYIMFK